MTLDSGNVAVAVTGAVSIGVADATAPTDASTALDATDWTDLGYVSEAGVVEAQARDTAKIKAWQFSATVREVVTDAGITWQVTFIETKKAVVELFYGATVTGADGQIDVNPALTSGRRKFCIDVIDGDTYERTYIAEGELVEAPGDRTAASGEALGYSVTITGYPSAELDGASCRKWFSVLETP